MIFSLIEFQQILYFDLDFYFQKNPYALAIESCSLEIICACRDYSMGTVTLKSSLDNPITINNYFNAGFLVVKPSLKVYNELIQRLKADVSIIEKYVFAEQDLLNVYFRKKWKILSPTFNVMHVKYVRENMIAIHEKLWILQQNFQSSKYLWNKDSDIPKLISSSKNDTSSEIDAEEKVSSNDSDYKERMRQKIYNISMNNDASTVDWPSSSSSSRRKRDKRDEISWQHTSLMKDNNEKKSMNNQYKPHKRMKSKSKSKKIDRNQNEDISTSGNRYEHKRKKVDVRKSQRLYEYRKKNGITV